MLGRPGKSEGLGGRIELILRGNATGCTRLMSAFDGLGSDESEKLVAALGGLLLGE
ncbi:MAG: hypothetical protein JO363_04520 [Solirubrobacterales bacterium]|nr:hypothetical protein [Solirubrobacterales bacterium]